MAKDKSDRSLDKEGGRAAMVFNLRELEVSPCDDIADPLPILYQESGGAPVLTPGGLSLVLGPPKSRKTTLCLGLMAALLGRPTIGFAAASGSYKVVYVDTEQGQSYLVRTARRVYRLMGWDFGRPDKRVRFFDLRDPGQGRTGEAARLSVKAQRLAAVRQIAREQQPDALFIDGVADLCDDFNDNKACSPLIDELMRMAAEGRMHICACLHTNKDKTTERGHLGVMYKQKCETTFLLEAKGGRTRVAPAPDGCKQRPFETFWIETAEPYALPALCEPARETRARGRKTREE
ncbi:MAG: AAA family ATPase [Prevotellaceae bacterium]|nr:AAA family ATPase [Prevotellaceae bacterium]